MKTAKFISLEGGEGAGKSSSLETIKNWLQAQNIAFIMTREPGGTSLGETIRSFFLQETMEAKTEALLLFAARMQHIEKVIKPALAENKWVICDRFTDSTYAYQGYARGLEINDLAWLEQWVQQGLQPDLTLLLDVPVAQGLQRSEQVTRFEMEGLDFHHKVRLGYQKQAQDYPDRITIIDSSQPQDVVKINIINILNHFYAG